MNDINTFTKLGFAMSRFSNGLMSYYSGAMLLMEPKLIMKYVGHYDIPDNFGWSWYDVAPDDTDEVIVEKYGYWENQWILALVALIGLF